MSPISSISHSDYRKACGSFLEAALLRPSNYFHSLVELEAMLVGHAYAFQQLGAINGDESFCFSFAEWLWSGKGLEVGLGWAPAFQKLASSSGRDVDELFAETVREFLSVWLGEDPIGVKIVPA